MVVQLTEELRRFSTTTSMKGLPRAAHAKSSGLRMAWCTAVLGFLCLSLYQTTSLVMAYLKFEKVTQIREVIFHPLNDVVNEVMPELSLCNLNPLSSNMSNYQDVPTFKEYLDLMKDFSRCSNCSREIRNDMEEVKGDIMSLIGYHQYIGFGRGTQVSQRITDFIVSCHVLVADGIMTRKVPCGHRAIPFTSRPYFNCVNLKLNENASIKGDVGVSLVLYLDNFDEEIDNAFDTANDVGQTSGAIMLLHEPNAIPIMETGQTVPPGQQTNIKLSISRREELGLPYGDCAELPEFYVEKYNITLELSHTICLSHCVHRQLQEQCGCRDIHLVSLNANTSLPFCGDPNLGAKDLIAKTKCSSEVRSARMSSCADRCGRGCTSITYNTECHSALWPRTSHLRSFYKHYIADKPYKDRFSILENISMTKSSFEDILTAESLVRGNFVKISMTMKGSRYTELKDIVKTDLPGLMSQLGGILNLYSGITVFFIIEILECFYRILTNCSGNDQVTHVESISKNGER